VSEIKHANKIYHEKELYALRTIKIPVVKDGVLYEEYLAQKNSEAANTIVDSNAKELINDGFYGDRKDRFRVQTQHKINSDLDFLPTSDDEDYDVFDRRKPEKQSLLLNTDERTITIGQPIDNSEPTLADFIERVDIRIQHEIKGVNSKKEDMEKVVDTLLSPVVFPADRKVTTDTYGSACFVSWKFWLSLLCIIAVVVPLFYVIHFKI